MKRFSTLACTLGLWLLVVQCCEALMLKFLFEDHGKSTQDARIISTQRRYAWDVKATTTRALLISRRPYEMRISDPNDLESLVVKYTIAKGQETELDIAAAVKTATAKQRCGLITVTLDETGLKDIKVEEKGTSLATTGVGGAVIYSGTAAIAALGVLYLVWSLISTLFAL